MRSDARSTKMWTLGCGLLFALGCAPGVNEVRRQAVHDLGCAPEEVKVTELTLAKRPLAGNPDDMLYEARGCDRRAEYWVKDRQIRPHHGEWYAPR